MVSLLLSPTGAPRDRESLCVYNLMCVCVYVFALDFCCCCSGGLSMLSLSFFMIGVLNWIIIMFSVTMAKRINMAAEDQAGESKMDFTVEMGGTPGFGLPGQHAPVQQVQVARYAHMHIHAHPYTHALMHIYTHAHTYTCTHSHAHTLTTQIHTYTHRRMHTQKHGSCASDVMMRREEIEYMSTCRETSLSLFLFP